jgi:hypothetical protein
MIFLKYVDKEGEASVLEGGKRRRTPSSMLKNCKSSQGGGRWYGKIKEKPGTSVCSRMLPCVQ